jgi:spore coat protein H
MMRPFLLILCLAVPALARVPASPAEVYDPSRLHVIHLSVTAQGWRMLQPERGRNVPREATTQPYVEGTRLPHGPAGYSYAYAKSQLEFDGQRLADVGIRFKGNASYAVSEGALRRPIKFVTDKFVPGQSLAKLTTFNLNPAAFDPSLLREHLAFSIFRDAGLPAPRTAYALLYATVPGTYDREYLGLYVLVEEVDDGPFLKNHFGDGAGLLLKPEGFRGLPYYGDDFAQYQRYNPKSSNVDPNLSRRIVELTKLIKHADDATFEGRIEQYLDVDAFLKYLAVNSVIANLDSFICTGHNYYLYVRPDTGRVTVVPWDMNLSFGSYTWAGRGEDQARLSLERPYADHTLVLRRLFKVPRFAEAYRKHNHTLATQVFTREKLAAKVAAVRHVFDAADRAAVAAKRVGAPTTRPVTGMGLVAPPLLEWIDRRCASLEAQARGDARDTFTAAFRDPAVLPGRFPQSAPIAWATLPGLDGDHDGQVTLPDLTAGFQALLAAAGVPQDGALTADAATRAIEKVLTPETRRLGTAAAYARILMANLDRDGDGRATMAELATAWNRLLAAHDRDRDETLDTRELVEAFVTVGVPSESP